jgi:hypothetical protein
MTASSPPTAARAAVLEVRDLKVSYTAGKEILKGISFDVGHLSPSSARAGPASPR